LTPLRAIAGIMYVETLHLLRNRTQAFIFLVIPLLIFVFLAGVYWDQVILHIPTVILDMDHSPMSREIIQGVEAHETLDIVGYATDYDQVQYWLQAEKARVAIVIPEDFDRKASRGEPTRILTIIDGSNMVFTNVATAATGEVVNHLAANLRTNLMLSQGLLTDKVRRILQAVQFPIGARYNPTFNYAYFLLFGLGLYILQQTYLLGMATVISREKEQGTWIQYQVLPFGRGDIYVGKLLPYLVVGLVQAGLIFLLGARVFGMPMHGKLWLLFLVTATFLLTVSTFGILVSGCTSRVNSIRFTMVMAMPSFILSGFTWPLDAMHPIARTIGECLPLTWYLQAFQSITMKGAGWDVVAPYIFNLAIITAVCFVLSLLFIKKTDRPPYRLIARMYPLLGKPADR